MAIELISKIKPKNGGNFPMVDANDVEFPDGTRLDQFVKNIPLQFVAIFGETSFEDVKAAYESGKPCVAVNGDIALPLVACTETMVAFGGFGVDGEGGCRVFTVEPIGFMGTWHEGTYNYNPTWVINEDIEDTRIPTVKAVKDYVGNNGGGSLNVVTYDLVALGFPNVICNGDPVYAETDTTEIMEVLATSIVTLNLNIAYSGLVFSNIKATFTPNSMYSIVGMPGLEFVVCLVVTEGKVTLSAKYAGFVPPISASDEGKFLQVKDGSWAAVAMQNVAEVGL